MYEYLRMIQHNQSEKTPRPNCYAKGIFAREFNAVCVVDTTRVFNIIILLLYDVPGAGDFPQEHRRVLLCRVLVVLGVDCSGPIFTLPVCCIFLVEDGGRKGKFSWLRRQGRFRRGKPYTHQTVANADPF